MIELSKLSREDLQYICEEITPKGIKEFFKVNSRGFAEICPGFRANKINDRKAIHLVLENCNKPFISRFLSDWIESQLMMVNSEVERLSGQDYDPNTALWHVLQASPFSKRSDLYFVLSGDGRSPDYIALMKSMIEYFPLEELQSRKVTAAEPEKKGGVGGETCGRGSQTSGYGVQGFRGNANV